MIETITLSKLTKKYIDNHDVICNGVHCRFIELEHGFGRVEKVYQVFGERGINQPVFTFKTIKRLKSFIRNR